MCGNVELLVDPRAYMVYGVGLQRLACQDYAFECHWGSSLSVVSVVCYQVEVSALG